MRRELFIHFSFWFFFFVLITLTHKYFNLGYWPFWLGGVVGTLLPDVDHLIYIYFLKPQDLTSQRVNYLINKQELVRVLSLLYETREERSGLIFHTRLFQIIFFVLTFWIMSSSGSLFGKGLVLAFSLHLIIDQIMDHSDIPKNKIYIATTLIAICIIGFLM